jgi:MFS family permease
MFRKLADRARNSDFDYRLLVPLLISTALIQMVTALVRVTTTYRAVELELSTVWLGAIAALFAIFPIFLAVWIGRYIDRGHDAHSAWIGAVFFLAACAGFALWPTAAALLAFTAVMGIGHMFLMASQQMLCLRCGGPHRREAIFGNYMVAGAIGQGLGPYIVGWSGGTATVPPTQLLFTVGAIAAGLSLAVILTMRPARNRPTQAGDSALVPVGELLRVPGLGAVILAGVVVVASSDIVVIFLPLLGTERGIDVRDIGLLLTVRAAASMVARLLYARLVGAVGRYPLMVASTLVCGVTFAILALPLPLAPIYATMAVMGFAFGLATTLSITIVVELSAEGARGTANSLRIMGNRIGQVALPFGAGLLAAASGVAGILVVSAVSLVASAVAVHWTRPTSSSV